MGICSTKERSVHVPPFQPPSQRKDVKKCDRNNSSLIRACISNDTNSLRSLLEYGVDLSSPYKGVPLIFSAALALLNDAKFERLRINWMLLVNHCKVKMPIVSNIDLNITNFTASERSLRSTCFPVIHIGELPEKEVVTHYKYQTTGQFGIIDNSDLRKCMVVVDGSLENILKGITVNTRNYNADIYDGTVTAQTVKRMRANARYILNVLNLVESRYDRTITYEQYRVKYQNRYDMEQLNSDIPYATVANSNSTDLPVEEEESGSGNVK